MWFEVAGIASQLNTFEIQVQSACTKGFGFVMVRFHDMALVRLDSFFWANVVEVPGTRVWYQVCWGSNSSSTKRSYEKSFVLLPSVSSEAKRVSLLWKTALYQKTTAAFPWCPSLFLCVLTVSRQFTAVSPQLLWGVQFALENKISCNKTRAVKQYKIID